MYRSHPMRLSWKRCLRELAANITKTGATDIVINETVNSDFVIASILNPNVGTATMLGATSLRMEH